MAEVAGGVLEAAGLPNEAGTRVVAEGVPAPVVGFSSFGNDLQALASSGLGATDDRAFLGQDLQGSNEGASQGDPAGLAAFAVLNRQDTTKEVNILPSQHQRFFNAEAAMGAEENEGPVAGSGHLEQGLDFVVGVGLAFVPGGGLVLNRASVAEGIKGSGTGPTQGTKESPGGGELNPNAGGR